MLRATSNSLTKASVWKNTAIYSSVKHYTTPNATPAPAENNEKKPSLSQRLGGTGRGKIMEGASDPFASFLANAKKPRNNNNRNGTFTPRNRKPQQAEGQFADAAEQPKQQRPRNENNGNNNNNNRNRNTRQNNNRQNDKQSADGASPTKENSNNNNKNNSNNNRRNNNSKNNNNSRNNNAQNGGKKLNMRRSQQPQEVRTRRATTFIDKDIDWSSFETATLTTETSETIVASTEQDSDELVLKDIQGDYDRYLSTGSELKWPQMIQGETLSTLVGSNPTFDLQQKTAFLAALSNGTNGIPASARK